MDVPPPLCVQIYRQLPRVGLKMEGFDPEEPAYIHPQATLGNRTQVTLVLKARRGKGGGGMAGPGLLA